MKYVIEKEISQDTIDQVYIITHDYASDYFTANFPNNMRIDMRFQQAISLKEGSEVISCIVFTCLDGSPHITLMVTKRNHSNKGYGKLLMEYFIDHIAQLGLNSIELYTFSPETRSVYSSTIIFYQNMGFKIERKYKDLWEEDTITLKMRKVW